MDPSPERVPYSQADDTAPDCDPEGDEGGKSGTTEDQGATPSEKAHANVIEDAATSDAVVSMEASDMSASSNSNETQYGSTSKKSLTGQQSALSDENHTTDGLSEATEYADFGSDKPTAPASAENVDNTEGEANSIVGSSVDERGPYETGDGRTGKQQVVVDGIILSESDTEASYSDNEAAPGPGDKDYVLHFSDSDQSLNVSATNSARELDDSATAAAVDKAGKTPTKERVKTAEVAEVAEVARAPSRPASTKVEQTAVSLQHGYELGEKTDCKQCANIHRGRVTERKLESSAKIREMTIGVGHELCAIKIIDKTKAPPQYLTKFLPREVKALRKVRGHPNVIQLYEFFHSGNFAYIVTEYCEGGTFLDYLNGQITRTGSGLPEQEARSFFRQLCSALIFCHNHSVIHRDLKCENILLDRNKNVKLSDFNYSKIVPELSLNSLLQTPCGSLSYAAPELFNAKTYDGQRADVWSLGVVLFSMLNGYLPFDESRIGEMQERMRTQRFTFVRGLSHEARLLLRSIMQWDPLKRPSVALIELEPWVTGRKLHPGERLYREQMENKVFRKNTSNNGIRCNRSFSSDDRVSQMVKTTATVTFHGHAQGAIVLKSRRPHEEPRLHGGYSRFPPKMIERAQRLSLAINMRRRSLRRSSVDQGASGGPRPSQDSLTDNIGHRGSEDRNKDSEVVPIPASIYEGPDGCLYTSVLPSETGQCKCNELPSQVEQAPASGAGGEANEACPDLRQTGGDAVDQPVDSRLPPRFASADAAAQSVSAYGLRGSKLLQLMSDQHSGQFRRRLTMGMPSYSPISTTVAPVRGKAKMMSARRDKVTLPGIQENDRTTPANFTQQFTNHYSRFARRPDMGKGESCVQPPSYASPSYDTSVPSLVPIVSSTVSGKHFDMVTLAASRQQQVTAASRENTCKEACRDNLPPVFHNMFPKWKKACKK